MRITAAASLRAPANSTCISLVSIDSLTALTRPITSWYQVQSCSRPRPIGVTQSAVLSQVKPAPDFEYIPKKARKANKTRSRSTRRDGRPHCLFTVPEEDGSDLQNQLESPVRPKRGCHRNMTSKCLIYSQQVRYRTNCCQHTENLPDSFIFGSVYIKFIYFTTFYSYYSFFFFFLKDIFVVLWDGCAEYSGFGLRSCCLTLFHTCHVLKPAAPLLQVQLHLLRLRARALHPRASKITPTLLIILMIIVIIIRTNG